MSCSCPSGRQFVSNSQPKTPGSQWLFPTIARQCCPLCITSSPIWYRLALFPSHGCQSGISAWHDAPQIEGVLPIWVQPTGAHDTYPLDFVVMHNGNHYISERENNDREPGTFDSGWRLDAVEPSEPEIPDWQPWDGHNESLHQVGDEVMHNGTHWRATVGNNHWEPGVFGWSVVS